MKKCVIASDSFKGTLSSNQIADLFESAFCEQYPNAKLEKVILGDGGENTLQVFEKYFKNGRYHYLEVTGPNFQKVKAKYFSYDDVAVIELAEASGLTLVEVKNPMFTTTYGVGELIKDAYLKGFRKFYVALGGSATNDGGCGLLAALGIKFLDDNNKEFIPTGGNLINIKDIVLTDFVGKDAQFSILSDVSNPMYGPNGAAHVFAKQKGAYSEEIFLLDRNLKYLNELFIKATNKDVSNIPGSGAAGAAASGMLAFLNANIVSGINEILNLINFDSIIDGADYVFTGEGKLDNQSFGGKLVSGVLERANKKNIKTICICGRCDIDSSKKNAFYKVYATSQNIFDFNIIKKNASKDYLDTVRQALKEI